MPNQTAHAYYGSAYFPSDKAEPYVGALRALDPTTGKLKWEFRHVSPTWSGVLSTAGGLVFTGDAEGNFIALDAGEWQTAVALSNGRSCLRLTDDLRH